MAHRGKSSFPDHAAPAAYSRLNLERLWVSKSEAETLVQVEHALKEFLASSRTKSAYDTVLSGLLIRFLHDNRYFLRFIDRLGLFDLKTGNEMPSGSPPSSSSSVYKLVLHPAETMKIQVNELSCDSPFLDCSEWKRNGIEEVERLKRLLTVQQGRIVTVEDMASAAWRLECVRHWLQNLPNHRSSTHDIPEHSTLLKHMPSLVSAMSSSRGFDRLVKKMEIADGYVAGEEDVNDDLDLPDVLTLSPGSAAKSKAAIAAEERPQRADRQSRMHKKTSENDQIPPQAVPVSSAQAVIVKPEPSEGNSIGNYEDGGGDTNGAGPGVDHKKKAEKDQKRPEKSYAAEHDQNARGSRRAKPAVSKGDSSIDPPRVKAEPVEVHAVGPVGASAGTGEKGSFKQETKEKDKKKHDRQAYPGGESQRHLAAPLPSSAATAQHTNNPTLDTSTAPTKDGKGAKLESAAAQQAQQASQRRRPAITWEPQPSHPEDEPLIPEPAPKKSKDAGKKGAKGNSGADAAEAPEASAAAAAVAGGVSKKGSKEKHSIADDKNNKKHDEKAGERGKNASASELKVVVKMEKETPQMSVPLPLPLPTSPTTANAAQGKTSKWDQKAPTGGIQTIDDEAGPSDAAIAAFGAIKVGAPSVSPAAFLRSGYVGAADMPSISGLAPSITRVGSGIPYSRGPRPVIATTLPVPPPAPPTAKEREQITEEAISMAHAASRYYGRPITHLPPRWRPDFQIPRYLPSSSRYDASSATPRWERIYTEPFSAPDGYNVSTIRGAVQVRPIPTVPQLPPQGAGLGAWFDALHSEPEETPPQDDIDSQARCLSDYFEAMNPQTATYALFPGAASLQIATPSLLAFSSYGLNEGAGMVVATRGADMSDDQELERRAAAINLQIKVAMDDADFLPQDVQNHLGALDTAAVEGGEKLDGDAAGSRAPLIAPKVEMKDKRKSQQQGGGAPVNAKKRNDGGSAGPSNDAKRAKHADKGQTTKEQQQTATKKNTNNDKTKKKSERSGNAAVKDAGPSITTTTNAGDRKRGRQDNATIEDLRYQSSRDQRESKRHRSTSPDSSGSPPPEQRSSRSRSDRSYSPDPRRQSHRDDRSRSRGPPSPRQRQRGNDGGQPVHFKYFNDKFRQEPNRPVLTTTTQPYDAIWKLNGSSHIARSSSSYQDSSFDPAWRYEIKIAMHLLKKNNRRERADVLFGEHPLPAPYGRDFEAFFSFVTSRPHLFFIQGRAEEDPRTAYIRITSEGLPLLEWKRRMLDFMFYEGRNSGYRVPLAYALAASPFPRDTPNIEVEEAKKNAWKYVLNRLGDAVTLTSPNKWGDQISEDKKVMTIELRPFGRNNEDISFHERCQMSGNLAQCKFGPLCRCSHAPPRKWGRK